MTRNINANTLDIRGQTSEIKDDMAKILIEIERLRGHLPQIDASNETEISYSFMLERYLDDFSTYAESVADVQIDDDPHQNPGFGVAEPTISGALRSLDTDDGANSSPEDLDSLEANKITSPSETQSPGKGKQRATTFWPKPSGGNPAACPSRRDVCQSTELSLKNRTGWDEHNLLSLGVSMRWSSDEND
jgi:hypothetical protein